MLSDVSMRVHQVVVVDEGPHACLKTCIYTHIKWLKFIGGVRWQGQNHNAIVVGIFNGLYCHVTLCVAHNDEELVCRGAKGIFLDVLQCFKETFPSHPARWLKDTL